MTKLTSRFASFATAFCVVSLMLAPSVAQAAQIIS